MAVETSLAEHTPKTAEELRREAVCRALAWSPRLVRYARYTSSIQDAEDAYQRAMEIALTGDAPMDDHALLAWLHVVIRHEALASHRVRLRERATAADVLSRVESPEPGPGAMAEWNERHRELRAALDALTNTERTCVALHGAGLSYREIVERTGFTMRKVERALLEGRKRLREWEARVRSGEECDRLVGTLGSVADGSAGALATRRADRHTAHCGACRAELRRMRARRAMLASFVPQGLLASTGVTGRPPDIGAFGEMWNRLSNATGQRAIGAWHAVVDLPGPMVAKVGAGAAAVAVVVGSFNALPRSEMAVADAPTVATTARVAPPGGAAPIPLPQAPNTATPPGRPVAARPRVEPKRPSSRATRTTRRRVSGRSNVASPASREFGP
ncbi:MAG: sigma-70 family RNA polymerase sigma factor [Actinobacteria bacterium]|nr:sigma-70 family RNA polymerase sigma factor [Actinomycetota bacterium]